MLVVAQEQIVHAFSSHTYIHKYIHKYIHTKNRKKNKYSRKMVSFCCCVELEASSFRWWCCKCLF